MERIVMRIIGMLLIDLYIVTAIASAMYLAFDQADEFYRTQEIVNQENRSY